MGFSSGNITFRRFSVVGQIGTSPTDELLKKFRAHLFAPSELGVPEEIEYGWCGAEHLYDREISFEHSVYADCIHIGLRIDTNRVPGNVKKSMLARECAALAAGNPSGFISKAQSRTAKETVGRQMEDELRAGKHRRSRLVELLWSLPSGVLYANAPGKTFEMLAELFERTFGLMLSPLTAGAMAMQLLEPKGQRLVYEDPRPTRFVEGSHGESEYPDYPWVARGPEPKDFLGNEFLLWLWHQAERKGEVIKTGRADVAILFDKSLDMECAYGQSGRESLRGDGPAHAPEANSGLRSGKLPRKAGLVIDYAGEQFSLTLGAEPMAFGSVRLPDVEDA